MVKLKNAAIVLFSWEVPLNRYYLFNPPNTEREGGVLLTIKIY